MEKPIRSAWVLYLIAIDKLAKAALLLFLAIGLHHLLLRPDLANDLARWVRHIRIDPENKHVHDLIGRITGINPAQLHAIRLGSYLYSALNLTEGIGLLLRKRWAEYLTVIVTALFLPLEIYEIFHGHHHLAKIGVFVLNLLIVVYLAWRLRRQLKLETGV
jgi:uncharacterized membrane protein (DUF2068 family)